MRKFNTGEDISDVEDAISNYFVGEEKDSLLSRLERYRDFGDYNARCNYSTGLLCD